MQLVMRVDRMYVLVCHHLDGSALCYHYIILLALCTYFVGGLINPTNIFSLILHVTARANAREHIKMIPNIDWHRV